MHDASKAILRFVECVRSSSKLWVSLFESRVQFRLHNCECVFSRKVSFVHVSVANGFVYLTRSFQWLVIFPGRVVGWSFSFSWNSVKSAPVWLLPRESCKTGRGTSEHVYGCATAILRRLEKVAAKVSHVTALAQFERRFGTVHSGALTLSLSSFSVWHGWSQQGALSIAFAAR